VLWMMAMDEITPTLSGPPPPPPHTMRVQVQFETAVVIGI